MLRPRLSAILTLLSTIVFVSLLAPQPAADAAEARRVTRVLIKKKEHQMQLLGSSKEAGHEEVIASYKVALGPGGAGPKTREGDQVTPVGYQELPLVRGRTFIQVVPPSTKVKVGD